MPKETHKALVVHNLEHLEPDGLPAIARLAASPRVRLIGSIDHALATLPLMDPNCSSIAGPKLVDAGSITASSGAKNARLQTFL